MRTCSLLAAVAVAVAYAVLTPSAADGEWNPIPDADGWQMQKLGKWAVEEHDREAGDGLKFARMVGGQVQVVAGLNYRLVINAVKPDGSFGTYNAEVHKQDWTNTIVLVSFAQAN